MTIEETIQRILFDYVKAISVTGSPPLAWPNVEFPAAGEEKPVTYIEVKLFPNSLTRLFVKGTDPHLRPGILQLTIRSALYVGPDPVTKLAGEVAEYFPADLMLFQDGVGVRIQQAPDVGEADKTDDEVSWRAIVSVRYEVFA